MSCRPGAIVPNTGLLPAGSGLLEKADDIGMASFPGQLESRLAIPGLVIDVRSRIKQRSNNDGLVSAGGLHQAGEPVTTQSINVRAGIQ